MQYDCVNVKAGYIYKWANKAAHLENFEKRE